MTIVSEAAVLKSFGEPLSIEQIIIPSPGFGQVHVRFNYASLCRSQIMEVDGHRGTDRWLPHMLGHEGVGEVIEVGEGVTRFSAGDEVVASWIVSAGAHGGSTTYQSPSLNGLINAGPCTTLCSSALISEDRLFAKPADIPLHLASLLGCALPTGAGIVFDDAKPSEDARVAIIGLGGIGLSALLTCKALGIQDIVVVDINRGRLELARKIGAAKSFYAEDDTFFTNFYQYWPEGADICIEAGGSVDSIHTGFSIINRNTGRLYFASHPPANQKIQLSPHELISGKKIHGCWGGGANIETTIIRLEKLFKLGKLDLDIFNGDIFDLTQINEAFTALAGGTNLRPIIKIA